EGGGGGGGPRGPPRGVPPPAVATPPPAVESRRSALGQPPDLDQLNTPCSTRCSTVSTWLAPRSVSSILSGVLPPRARFDRRSHLAALWVFPRTSSASAATLPPRKRRSDSSARSFPSVLRRASVRSGRSSTVVNSR